MNIPSFWVTPNPSNYDHSRIDRSAYDGYFFNFFIPNRDAILKQDYKLHHPHGIYQQYGYISILSAGIVPVVSIARQYSGPVPLSMSPDYAREPNYKYEGRRY